mmetsp:Transcript_32882/g.37422  ORF Transcript_32882/g.37422 Transcript_32882/m.37422 type:complete len:418 (+) Transcript_32882:27-1280(+)
MNFSYHRVKPLILFSLIGIFYLIKRLNENYELVLLKKGHFDKLTPHDHNNEENREIEDPAGTSLMVEKPRNDESRNETQTEGIIDFRNHFTEKNLDIDWEKVENQQCITAGNGSAVDVKQRLSYAVIIGAMKAGTSALGFFIRQHSLVAPMKKKEQHFFDIIYYKKKELLSDKGILQEETRTAYLKYARMSLKGEVTKLNNKIAIQDSPRYLFWSDQVPARIVCALPWVKIMAVLRNPIDRAYSHYNMKHISPRSTSNITFEAWIEDDIQIMRNTGVIQSKIPFNEFRGSEMELNAWKSYIRKQTHAPIGRGLYAIQLRHWFKAFENAGKSRDDILIIQSEVMKKSAPLVHKDALEFLELPYEPIEKNPKSEKKKNIGHYDGVMREETRERLNELYAPYNRDLYELLGEDWDGIWND